MNSWVSGQRCHVIPLLLNTPSQSMKCFNQNITTNCHPVQLMGSSVPLRLYLQILNHPFSQQQPSPPSLRPAALSCAVKIIHKARFVWSIWTYFGNSEKHVLCVEYRLWTTWSFDIPRIHVEIYLQFLKILCIHLACIQVWGYICAVFTRNHVLSPGDHPPCHTSQIQRFKVL